MAFGDARTSAMFVCDEGDEDRLLTAFVTNMNVRQGGFKLFPAYACYLLVRGCQSQDNTHARTAVLLRKMATLLKMALMDSHDLASRVYWFANCSELSMVLRSDLTLVDYGCAQTQQELAEVTREAHEMILSSVRQRFKAAPLGLLYDTSAFPAQPSEQLKGALAAGAACATEGCAHDARSTKKGRRQQQQQQQQQQTMRGSSPECPTIAVQMTVVQVLESLDALWQVLKGCLVSQQLVKQVLDATLRFIGDGCFNKFVANPAAFQCEYGMLLRYNLTRVSEWARSKGLSTEGHFAHIVQAAQLLQAQKTSLQYLDMICDSCNKLNSLQMEHILCNYQPTQGEEPIASNLIDCIKGRFMASIDKQNLACDDSLAGKILLYRNTDYALPFRLSGRPHMGSGLVEPDLVRSIKADMNGVLSSRGEHLQQRQHGKNAGGISCSNSAHGCDNPGGNEHVCRADGSAVDGGDGNKRQQARTGKSEERSPTNALVDLPSAHAAGTAKSELWSAASWAALSLFHHEKGGIPLPSTGQHQASTSFFDLLG